VRSLDRLLQLEDGSVLLLADLPQLLVQHAFLDQLLGELRDLCVPELKRGPRLLQRDVLPLELALRLLPG
jgi:hypothetical protein